MRAGRVSRHLAAELPAIEEVTPQPVVELEATPAEELRIASTAPSATARPHGAPLLVAPAEPAPAALDALAATASRLRDGIPAAQLGTLDAPTRAALAPRLAAAQAMLREVATLLALRDEATAKLRSGGRA